MWCQQIKPLLTRQSEMIFYCCDLVISCLINIELDAINIYPMKFIGRLQKLSTRPYIITTGFFYADSKKGLVLLKHPYFIYGPDMPNFRDREKFRSGFFLLTYNIQGQGKNQDLFSLSLSTPKKARSRLLVFSLLYIT